MMTMDDLIAALNDPNSPMRERLLHNLAMSPLDPAAAFQQIKQQGGQMDLGGAPPAPVKDTPSMADLLQPGQRMGMQVKPMEPGVNVGSTGPWNFDYSGQNNGALASDVNNPNFVPPAAAQAAGMSPQAEILPGEPGSGGGVDVAQLKKILEGAGGLNQQRPTQYPLAPAAPVTNNWKGFTAGQLQTPGAMMPMTLAQLLNGR